MSAIVGAVRLAALFAWGGHIATGLHLDDLASVPSTGRGLSAADFPGQIREMQAMAKGLKTARPFYHVYISPRFQDPILINLIRDQVEKMLGLEHAPRISPQLHPKGLHRGDHGHFLYLLAKPDFKVVDLRWDFLKRETANVAGCYERGAPAPPIAHPVAVANWLRTQGRSDVAEWLMQHASARKLRNVAVTPAERQQAERTGVPKQQVQALIYGAFDRARDGPTFVDLLLAAGLVLAQGGNELVAVDRAGGAHSIRRAVAVTARALKPGARVSKKTIHARLGWVEVPSLEEVRDEQRNREPEPERDGHDPAGASGQDAPGDGDAIGAGAGGARSGDHRECPGALAGRGEDGEGGGPDQQVHDGNLRGDHRGAGGGEPGGAAVDAVRGEAGPAGEVPGGTGHGHGDHAGPGQGDARPDGADRSEADADRGAAARLIRDRVVLAQAFATPKVRAAMSLLRDASKSTTAELAEETIRSLNGQWRAARADLVAKGRALTPRLPSPEIDLLDRDIAKSKATARKWLAKAAALEKAPAVPEPVPLARGWWGRLVDACWRLVGSGVPSPEIPEASPDAPVAERGAVSTPASCRAAAARHEREAGRKEEKRPAVVTAHRLREVNAHEAAKAALERRMVDLSDGVVMVREDPATAIDARVDLLAALARWRRTGNGGDRRHGFAPP